MTFLSSKFVEQTMFHVFFHLTMMAQHIASVLQSIMINHGALLRLMIMEIMIVATGITVTATVKPVEQVKVRQSRNDFFKSMVLPINEHTNLTLLL